MKNNWILLVVIIMLLMIVPSVIANDETIVGQPTTLWADILDGATFYSVTSANISIYNAQAQLVASNQPMTNLATGRYYYNYTPNTTGIFYTYTTFQNATGLVATASSTFYVAPFPSGQSDDMAGLGVILALGIAIAVFAYLAFGWKTTDNGTTTVWKTLSMIILMLLLIVLAWASIDANNVCSLTYDASSSSGYTTVCEQGQFNQGSTFLKLMMVVTIIFFVWISVALFISSINHLRSTGKF